MNGVIAVFVIIGWRAMQARYPVTIELLYPFCVFVVLQFLCPVQICFNIYGLLL